MSRLYLRLTNLFLYNIIKNTKFAHLNNFNANSALDVKIIEIQRAVRVERQACRGEAVFRLLRYNSTGTNKEREKVWKSRPGLTEKIQKWLRLCSSAVSNLNWWKAESSSNYRLWEENPQTVTMENIGFPRRWLALCYLLTSSSQAAAEPVLAAES